MVSWLSAWADWPPIGSEELSQSCSGHCPFRINVDEGVTIRA